MRLLNDEAACTGLRWTSNKLENGTTQKFHGYDCPQRDQCARFHHGIRLSASGGCGVWVEEPERGVECTMFVPHKVGE